ncbi:MAG: hypothetical protein IPO37_23830 [Saprospiraceae bacterium]|nr:hypothetical protein [Saprospiraceae bacterium]
MQPLHDVELNARNLKAKRKIALQELVDAFPWQGDTDYLLYKVEQVQ